MTTNPFPAIRPVPWDSRFFEFPVGHLYLPSGFSIHSPQVVETLRETLRAKAAQFRLVYIVSEENGPDNIEGLDSPAVCYDRKVVFDRQVAAQVPPPDPHIQSHTELSCPKQLEMLAIRSGMFSRFLKDPFLSPQYERLFLTWIHQSISGNTADAVWVWTADDGTRAGLITTRAFQTTNPLTGQTEREGRLGLLSVDQNYRHQGAAKSLLGACEYWANTLSIPKLSLATQKDNAPVIHLCEKCGYESVAELSVYHYWTPQWKYNPRVGWRLSTPAKVTAIPPAEPATKTATTIAPQNQRF